MMKKESGERNEMERVCEFCTAFKSVVYCKSDAANLCLSCDAKVHSANSLSGRHPRFLLCDSCRYRPCTARCLEHDMFLCHVCDASFHGVSSKHKRRPVSCYTGCPSANDFMAMWGFNSMSKRDRTVVGSNSKMKQGEVQRENGLILEQIHELEKLQLSHGNGGLGMEEETDGSASAFIGNVSEDVDKLSSCIMKQSEELMVDFSPSPFPQMEHLSSSSSSVDNSFWQCKGTSKNYQLWYQNLQDIGVCEDTESRDDFDIPDIDLTFRNFEDHFGVDQDTLATGVSDNDVMMMMMMPASIENTDHHPLPMAKPPFSSPSLHCPSKQASLSDQVHSTTRLNPISRLKEKRKTRIEEKQTHYVPQKGEKGENSSSETVGITHSY